MKAQLNQAIASVAARTADGAPVSGSSFLVTDRHLLTAFHVVGDRVATQKGTPTFHNELAVSFAHIGLTDLPARIATDCFDASADWALIELDRPVANIRPIPLGTVSSHEIDQIRRLGKSLNFETWGFPAVATPARSGITIDGRIQNESAYYQEAWAYQLYSDNAAGGIGNPLSGLSGAPCLIDDSAVGIIRSNLIAGPGQIVGGILYACPVATPTLQEKCAKYLPDLDPSRGLPGLPRKPLPIEPFRYLRWYGADHAEVFFGRSRKVRDLYVLVTDPETPPIVLVYGSSGVGKSSLLEAGLLPRLSWNYELTVQRREATKTLVHIFNDQLVAARAAAQTSGKPIVLLLDQIEEVFTDQGIEGNAELRALAERIKALVGAAEQPFKIILGFRSEWLADIRTRLAEAGLSVSEFYLERLTKEEIEEIVLGVTSTDRLKRFYNMMVDESLPECVAGDLLKDPKSPVTPILSIVLTRLWDEAKKRRAGEQSMSQAVYNERMRDKFDLDRFLSEQINLVATTRRIEVASGLVTDVLYRHTTEYATAKELSWNELCKIYSQFVEANMQVQLQGLLATLKKCSLLYAPESLDGTSNPDGKQQITRLAHDTLATPARKNYQKSDLPGQRAERRLASRVEDWNASEPTNNTLEESALKLMSEGKYGTRAFNEQERDFIKASEDALRASEEARRAALRRSRREKILAGALAVIGAVLLTGSYFGTSSVWRSSELPRLQNGEVRVTAFQMPNRTIVVTDNNTSTIVWDPRRGEASNNYQAGAKFDFTSPYLVMKNVEWRGSAFFAFFTFANLETKESRKSNLDFVLENDRAWIDQHSLFILRSFMGKSLSVTDLNTNSDRIIKDDEYKLDKTRAYIVDADRMLLLNAGEGRSPDIWSFSQKKILASLKTPNDKATRTLAASVVPGKNQAVTIQLFERETKDNDDVENHETSNENGNDTTSTKEHEKTSNEATNDTTSNEENDETDYEPVSIRIWDLTTQEPSLVKELPIKVSEITSQLTDPSPESGFRWGAGVKVFAKTIAVAVSVKDPEYATLLYDLDLNLLDHGSRYEEPGTRFVYQLSPGSVGTASRPFLYVQHPERFLNLWNLDTGDHITFPDFSMRPFGRLVANNDVTRLLAPQEDSTFDIWDVKTKTKNTVPIRGVNLKDAFFTLENSAIFGLHDGGALTLWTLTGQPLGVLSGVGTGSPLVQLNAEQCEAIVWSPDGRVLKFRTEWQILGLFHVKKPGCGSAT